MFNMGEYTLAAFFGVLITLIIGHFLAKDRERQIHKAISYHAAAEKFRIPFDDALFNIDQGQHATSLLLQQFFESHKLAMWHFKHRLSGIAGWRFKKAWGNYEKFYNQTYQKDDVLAQFVTAKDKCEIQKLDELRKHIGNLLKFTT